MSYQETAATKTVKTALKDLNLATIDAASIKLKDWQIAVHELMSRD